MLGSHQILVYFVWIYSESPSTIGNARTEWVQYLWIKNATCRWSHIDSVSTFTAARHVVDNWSDKNHSIQLPVTSQMPSSGQLIARYGPGDGRQRVVSHARLKDMSAHHDQSWCAACLIFWQSSSSEPTIQYHYVNRMLTWPQFVWAFSSKIGFISHIRAHDRRTD